MSRKYGDLRTDAATIAHEVVVRGSSTGWAGDLEQLDTLRRQLARFGIEYTDDIRGTWEPSELHDALAALTEAQVSAVIDFARILQHA